MMPVFRLDPISTRCDDPRWEASRFRETCWIIARDEDDARQQLQGIALKVVDMIPGRKILYSPWLISELADCKLDTSPPVSLKEGIVLTISGKTCS
jgi:hypothetical protein